MLFKKESTDFISLLSPDDSIAYFKDVQQKSERYWAETGINPSLYGFQIQQGTHWLEGLDEDLLGTFEQEMGFAFPAPRKTITEP